MKRFSSSIAGLAVAATLWAQQPAGERQAVPRGEPEKAGSSSALTILITYPEGIFPEAQAQAWEQNLHAFMKVETTARGSDWHSVRAGALLEAMLYGPQVRRAGPVVGMVTGAGAPLPGGSRSTLEGETLGRIFASQGEVASVVLKQIGGGTPCPPADCGCDKSSIGCGCGLLKKTGEPDFCMCPLCPIVTKIPPMPEPERRANRRSLVILVTDDWQSVPKLAEAARREVAQMGPPTANLVIKTKSIPP